MELMFQPLRKYADFQGRARRSEYWLFALFILIVEMLAVVLATLVGGEDSMMNIVFGLVFFGFLVATFVPSLAVTVRRLHDSNRSGFWVFISFLPFLGGIILFVFSLLDGTPGANRFGPDPKGREVHVF